MSKEDILAGQSPGLFWTMEEPTGLTVEERSRRASSEEMFKEQILKGVSPGIFWSMPPKGGEEHLDSSLAENSTEKTSVRTLSGVIPESVQKASKWARVKDGILAGKRKAQASRLVALSGTRREHSGTNIYTYRSRVVDV